MRVVTEILNAQPKGSGTDLRVALDMLGGVAKRRSVAFLVSDFIAGPFEHSIRVASARHDIIPIQVIDPREEELPDVGLALMEDLETGEEIEVDTSDPAVRQAYSRAIAKDRAQREQLFRRLRMDHVTVHTDRPYVRALAELFRMRERRLTGYR
jgi:uncharacterized protein (DUF58 family)